MANLDALHDAVVADPESDAPRLAYADAIAATDPARADLIRTQIRLAQWRRAGQSPPEAGDAEIRAGTLIRAHGATWAANIKPLADSWQFLRGFVELVALDAGAFLMRARDLYRRAPVLHLDLTNARPVFAELMASPALERIHSLKLRDQQLGDTEARALAASPRLGKLAWLDLSDNQIGMEGFEALVASRHLPRLGYLGFRDNRIPDPTPQHADEYDADSALALELQKKHGARPWLSAKPRATWPPPRDAVH
jgi:uncharacterized protein (TIGR02996 family)